MHRDDPENDPELALERKKLAIDTKLRRQELGLKLEESRRSRWASPLVLVQLLYSLTFWTVVAFLVLIFTVSPSHR